MAVINFTPIADETRRGVMPRRFLGPQLGQDGTITFLRLRSLNEQQLEISVDFRDDPTRPNELRHIDHW